MDSESRMKCADKKVLVPALELNRLAEAEAMVARFSRENQWLALQVRHSAWRY